MGYRRTLYWVSGSTWLSWKILDAKWDIRDKERKRYLQVIFYLVPKKQVLPEAAGDTGCNTESVTVVSQKGCSGASNIWEEKTL